jgi:translation elongation factor EF-Tu-like GTPase
LGLWGAKNWNGGFGFIIADFLGVGKWGMGIKYKTTHTKKWNKKGESADNVSIKNYCNGVQREHNKKLNNGLPILHKVPPKRDYGRYFYILAEKGGTSHGGLTEKLSPFFYAQKQEVNAYGR